MAMMTKISAVKQNHSNTWTMPVNIYAKDEALAQDKWMESSWELGQGGRQARREKEWTIKHN